MQLQRFSFKTFEEMGTAPPPVPKKFLPTGRSREEAPPPPPTPTFSEEQVKAAERDGYKKGFLEGSEEGRKQAESEQAAVNRQLAQTVEKFIFSIVPLMDEYKQLALLVRSELPKMALAMAKKVAGPALQDGAAKIIEDMVTRCLEHLNNEPKITLTVAESLAPALEGKLKELSASLPAAAHTTVKGDKLLAAADCRIAWDHGAMERSSEQLWKQLEAVAGNLSAFATREVNESVEKLKTPPAEAAVTEQKPEEKKE